MNRNLIDMIDVASLGNSAGNTPSFDTRGDVGDTDTVIGTGYTYVTATPTTDRRIQFSNATTIVVDPTSTDETNFARIMQGWKIRVFSVSKPTAFRAATVVTNVINSGIRTITLSDVTNGILAFGTTDTDITIQASYTDPTGIDTAVGSGGAVLGFIINAIVAGPHVVTLQHSDDDSTWASVPAEDVTWNPQGGTYNPGQFENVNPFRPVQTYQGVSNTNRGILVQYNGDKRYIRLNHGGFSSSEIDISLAIARRKYRGDAAGAV